MIPGRFISFEGGEGTGKSTQARRLAALLRGRGLSVVETREPGGSEGAETIRGLLLGGADDRWTAEAEALLFAAARADHVARTVAPALESGAWVVSDRFLDSSRAYQGAGLALGDDAIRALHGFGSRGLLPDRTILLHANPEVCADRLNARDAGVADRIGARDLAYHRTIAAAFLRFAEEECDRFRIVDASLDADTVAGLVADALAGLA